MRSPKKVARHAAIAFLAHGLLVVTVAVLQHRPGGANIHGWDVVRIIRLAEFPVLWAIDWILQSVWLVPVSWFQPHFELAYAANGVLTYILVGGAFYAALAASVSSWLGRHEPGPS